MLVTTTDQGNEITALESLLSSSVSKKLHPFKMEYINPNFRLELLKMTNWKL